MWIRSCTVRFALWLKAFPHSVHMYCLFSAWILSFFAGSEHWLPSFSDSWSLTSVSVLFSLTVLCLKFLVFLLIFSCLEHPSGLLSLLFPFSGAFYIFTSLATPLWRSLEITKFWLFRNTLESTLPQSQFHHLTEETEIVHVICSLY